MKRLIAACLWCASLLASAQTTAERLAWTPLRGTAVDLSVGADGTAFSLDPDGLVWMRRPGPGTGWMSLPGNFRRIDAASERDAWAVDAEGAVWHYNGSYWQSVPAPVAADVGVGAGGMAYVATREGGLARWDSRTGFVPIAGAPAGIRRVDVDERDLPWVVLADNALQRFDGRAWQVLPGQAHDVSAGVRASAFMVSPGRQPFRWNAALGSWGPLLAVASVVAAGPDNKPWIVTPEGAIFTNDTGTPQSARRPAAEPSVFSKNVAWRRVQGRARVLSLSAKGQAVALGPEGEVWQWKGKDQWQRLPGTFERIALAPSGQPMALTAQGRIYSYRGSQWLEQPGQALDIAIAPQGVVWILLPDGSPAYWDAVGGWVSLGAPGPAVRLAVGSANVPWVLTAEGQVLHYEPRGWQPHDGLLASELAIGPEGSVFVAGRDRVPARWDEFLQRWERINTEAVAVAVGPGDKPWVVNARGEIYASSLFEEPVPSGGECSAAVGGKLPDFRLGDFRPLSGAAARGLAIGKDGNVMAIDTDSNLGQWRNSQQRFKLFPGQMARLALAPDGKPWGVTAKGEVWRHDGGQWRLVRTLFVARDIATACNGTVMAAASDESLYKYNTAIDAFERLMPPRPDDPAPKGKKLALDPAGRPWTIRDDWVYRCDVQPCERQALRAREIAIGPEGTLLAVDMDGNLQSFNARDNRWDRSGVANVAAVAVGPGGKPWVVRNGTEVWASAFFNRREDQDDQTAAATQSTPVNTSNAVSPFTFSTTLVFDEVTYKGVGLPTPIHALGIGASGKVMAARGTGAAAIVAYDPVQQGFVPGNLPMMPGGELDGIAVGQADSLWVWRHPVNGSVDGGIWIYKNGTWQAVSGVPALGISDVPLPAFAKRWLDVAALADGSVYVMGPDTGGAGVQESTMYRNNAAGSNQFVTTPFQLPGNEDAMAVEPGGAVWLVRSDLNSPFTRRAFQYINNAFFERPPPAGLSVCPTFPASNRAVPGCLAAGANGSVFAIGLQGSAPRLLRWNAASGQWDVVVTSPAVTKISYLVVAPDGRPWMIASTDGVNFKVYKAR